jgi:hypothetical protein
MSKNMEFLKSNRLNTNTMLVVPADNTGTQDYLLDRNPRIPFTSVGFESNSSLILSIVFPGPTVLSHVLLQNHNLKQFRAFYDSVTANALFTVTQNSATSTYHEFNSITVNTLQIQLDQAVTAATEKSERRLAFAVNPASANYKPVKKRTRIRHEMPDGGVKMLQISDKFRTSIEFSFITETFRGSLESVYDEGFAVVFVPFGTTTGWGGNGMGEAYEVLWTNDWNFAHGTNDKTQGFNGSLLLEETPSA